MYILTTNFLYTSDTVTSIKFEASNTVTTIVDFNTRQLVVNYVPNLTKYSDIIVNNFETISDDFIVDNTFLLRKGNTNINNIIYYTTSDIKKLSQIITNILPSGVYINGVNCIIIINSEDTEKLNTILNSDKIHCIFHEDSFVTNFSSLNTYNNIETDYTDKRVYTKDLYAIMEQDIVSAWVDHMRSVLPDFIISPELQESSEIDNKSRLMFYKAGISSDTQIGDYSRVFRNHPEMGHWKRANITVRVEFLFDDIENYLYFRNSRLYELGFWNSHLFTLTDFLDNEYNCVANWEFVQDTELDQSPETKSIDTSNLYSYKTNVVLIGYTMEKIVEYPTILQLLTNIYTKESDDAGYVLRTDNNIIIE